jgi:hypothetical protein
MADTCNNRIQKLSSAGQPLAQWGSEAAGPGQFNGPNSVAVVSSGNVYVADTRNHRIQKLSRHGDLVANFWNRSAPDEFP